MFRNIVCLLALSFVFSQWAIASANADEIDDVLDYLVESRQADLHEERAAEARAAAAAQNDAPAGGAPVQTALSTERRAPAQTKVAKADKPVSTVKSGAHSAALVDSPGSYRF